MVFPFIASFVIKSLGFEERCELIRLNAHYSDIADKISADRKDEVWVEEDPMMLRFETEELKHVVVNFFESHCRCCLYSLEPSLSNHLKKDLKNFGSIYFPDARPVENFTVLIKQ